MISPLLDLVATESGFVADKHYTNPNGSLFGGMLLAQAFLAMRRALDDANRAPHSLHAYFINRGNASSPITYRPDIVRSGNSFTAMNAVASQNDKTIMTASMSFQKPEDNGLNHVKGNAETQAPAEQDIKLVAKYQEAAKTDAKFRLLVSHKNRYFDIVPTKENPYVLYQDGTPRKAFWIRLNAKAHIDKQDLAKHQACLMMVSDMGILYSSLVPYQVNPQKTQLTSIDHTVWLHDPAINLNEWHLIKSHSVWAANSRSLVHAEIYNQAGHLVAHIAQEGLVRTALLP